jgi:hypothetical protein
MYDFSNQIVKSKNAYNVLNTSHLQNNFKN